MFTSPQDVTRKLKNIRLGVLQYPLPDLIFSDLAYSKTPNPRNPLLDLEEDGLSANEDMSNGGLLVIEASRSETGRPIPVILMTNRTGLYDAIQHDKDTDVYLMDKSLERFDERGIVYNVGAMLRPDRFDSQTVGKK